MVLKPLSYTDYNRLLPLYVFLLAVAVDYLRFSIIWSYLGFKADFSGLSWLVVRCLRPPLRSGWVCSADGMGNLLAESGMIVTQQQLGE